MNDGRINRVQPQAEPSPVLLRVQRGLSVVAVDAQILSNRLANNGHRKTAQRVAKAAEELARVCYSISGDRACLDPLEAEFEHVAQGRRPAVLK